MNDSIRTDDQVTFSELVYKDFQFLVTPYGFSQTHSDSHSVRFENNLVHVTVSYGRTSREVRVGIGLLEEVYDGREIPFNLGEIVRLADPSKDQLFTLFQASTPDRLRWAIAEVAEIVARYGGPALRGDGATFKALSELRERECGAYMLKLNLSSARPRANEAWRNREYAEYVMLMEPLKHSLEQSEIKKLEYAQRKTSGLN